MREREREDDTLRYKEWKEEEREKKRGKYGKEKWSDKTIPFIKLLPLCVHVNIGGGTPSLS